MKIFVFRLFFRYIAASSTVFDDVSN